MKRLALLGPLLLIFPVISAGQRAPTPEPTKILIEANEWNRTRLLDQLNQQGAKHGMKFVLAEQGYEYRIRFATGKTPEPVVVQDTGGALDYDTGVATVYDSEGRELFQIKHEYRHNEAGAISGTAKDIVKRLGKMNSERTKKPK